MNSWPALSQVAILALALAATGGRWRPFPLGGPNLAEVPERTKTRTQLVEEAINAALERKWQAALELNQEIAERFGLDEETHNRLGKAFTELGNLDDPLSPHRATLKHNPLNPSTTNNSSRLQPLL